MRELNRRAFLVRSGAVAAAAGAAGLAGASPAAAADITGDVHGQIQDQGGELFDIREYGAVSDITSGANGSVSSGSTNFTSNAIFASTDVGKAITIPGAGPAGAALGTTIAAYISSGNVTLATAASTSVSSVAFTFGKDNTAAILSAISAAAGTGRLYAPPGTFMIRGGANGGAPIEFTGAVGLLGAGVNTSGSEGSNTVFFCVDATAGLLVTGSGAFQGFQVHGNNVATAPLQNGKLVSNVAQASSGATFTSVWVSDSAGNGWTIYGAQNNSYRDCRARLNKGDGVYIDGGAGGLHFWHWEESDNAGYGVHGNNTTTGGTGTYVDHTEDIHFYSGICDGSSATGVGKMYLKGATNWSFPALSLVGNSSMTGPTVVLDQSSGYGLDFSGCWVWGNSFPGIKVINSPTGSTPRTYLITDGVQWHNSATSVSITGSPGSNRYSGRGWMYDLPTAGPTGGPDGDTLIIGRTGPWITPSFGSGWSSQGIVYRINSDGVVEFKGSNTSSTGTATYLFTLDPGYRPDHTLKLPVQVNTGVTYLTIASDGTVTATGVGLLQQIFLDGLSFPVR